MSFWNSLQSLEKLWTIAQIVLIVAGLIIPVSTGILWIVGSRIKNLTKTEQAKIDKIKDTERIILKKELDKTIQSANSLKTELSETKTKLESINIESKKVSRGIVNLYDFNGTKRTQSPGKSVAIVGEEISIFQKIVALEKSKKYSNLIKLCEQQIKKTPTWLTPYLYLGIAYANTDDKAKAIVNLKHVIENAPNDPDYADAQRILDLFEKQ